MTKEYFSHDIDALSDIKIVKMMQDYDFTGFGYYWAIIEEIYKNGGRYYFEDLGILSKATGIKQDELKTFIDKCTKKYTHKDKGLFVSDGKCFWSVSLLKRMELKNKRAEARKSAITNRIELKDSELVNLTADEYEKLKAKYGENLINTAILALEDWLQSGKSKISNNAKNALGKPHYYYFRKDGWVLQKAKKMQQDNQPNWSV